MAETYESSSFSWTKAASEYGAWRLRVKTLRMVTVWRAVSQLVMAIESEKAASSRCGERRRIFRCGS